MRLIHPQTYPLVGPVSAGIAPAQVSDHGICRVVLVPNLAVAIDQCWLVRRVYQSDRLNQFVAARGAQRET
jgi:hypothetical protein